MKIRPDRGCGVIRRRAKVDGQSVVGDVECSAGIYDQRRDRSISNSVGQLQFGGRLCRRRVTAYRHRGVEGQSRRSADHQCPRSDCRRAAVGIGSIERYLGAAACGKAGSAADAADAADGVIAAVIGESHRRWRYDRIQRHVVIAIIGIVKCNVVILAEHRRVALVVPVLIYADIPGLPIPCRTRIIPG